MDKLSELLTAINALAEMIGEYRDGLIRNGFTRKEAIELCKEYTKTVLGNGKSKDAND